MSKFFILSTNTGTPSGGSGGNIVTFSAEFVQRQKRCAVEAIARLGFFGGTTAIQTLLQMIYEGALDRKELVVALKSLGNDGEKYVINLLQNQNPRFFFFCSDFLNFFFLEN